MTAFLTQQPYNSLLPFILLIYIDFEEARQKKRNFLVKVFKNDNCI